MNFRIAKATAINANAITVQDPFDLGWTFTTIDHCSKMVAPLRKDAQSAVMGVMARLPEDEREKVAKAFSAETAEDKAAACALLAPETITIMNERFGQNANANRFDASDLCLVVVDWKGVMNDEGEQVPFTRENLAELAKTSDIVTMGVYSGMPLGEALAQHVVTEFLRAVNDREKAEVENKKKSASGSSTNAGDTTNRATKRKGT